MKNKKMLLSRPAIVLFFAITAIWGYSSSAEQKPPLTPEMVNTTIPATVIKPVKTGAYCFEQYPFPIIDLSASADKDSYQPGEKVNFSGSIKNKNDFPIIDGQFYVRIGKKNPEYLAQGNFTVDEYFALERVALNPKEVKAVNFSWTAPKESANGEYRADFFFTVGKRYYLAGIPYSNDVVAGFSDFKIESGSDDSVYFDRSATKVNGEPYAFIGNSPRLVPGFKTSVTQKITNTFSQEKSAKVTYELYWMDGLTGEYKLSTKQESVSIPANGSKELSYEIEKVEESVYMLKITAQSGTQKSAVNIRMQSDIDHLRINYPSLNKFPLKEGEEAMIFTCFHNSSISTNAPGKLTVQLTDKEGNLVEMLEYSGEFAPMGLAEKKSFKAKNDYDWLKLDARITDKNGKVVDKYQTVYDCKELGKCLASEQAGETGGSEMMKKGFAYGFIAFFVIIIVAAILLYRYRDKLTLFIGIFLALSFFTTFGSQHAQAAGEQTISVYTNYSKSIPKYAIREWTDGNCQTYVMDCCVDFQGGWCQTYSPDWGYYPPCPQFTINTVCTTNTQSLMNNCSYYGYAQISYVAKGKVKKGAQSPVDLVNGATLAVGDAIELSITNPMPPFYSAWAYCNQSVEYSTEVTENKQYIVLSLTPYGAWQTNRQSPPAGSYYWLNIGLPYNVSVSAITNSAPLSYSSSNPNVISCSGATCTAVGAGSATLTAQAGQTQGVNWYGNEGQDLVFPSGRATWNVTVGAPTQPPTLTVEGPSTLQADQEGSFITTGTDPEGKQVQYFADWDNDGTSDETGPWLDSGQPYTFTHSWPTTGPKQTQFQVRDADGGISSWVPWNLTINSAPIPGQCKTPPNNQSYCSPDAPPTNANELCQTYDPTHPPALSGSGPWSWTCYGSGGGENASCNAYVGTQIVPQCGSPDFCAGTGLGNPCVAGTASDYSDQNAYEVSWTCTGSCPSTSITCTAKGKKSCGWIETNP